MPDAHLKTLRLHMPQWQGGNLAEYHLGSRMLSWLLPPTDGPEETVPVPPPRDHGVLAPEKGIVARQMLLDQTRAAREAIQRHSPDRVLTIGGDCLVDLAPIAYLSERYGHRLGVLWIDAHPDVQTSKETPHAHAQVLGHLLGRGDADFAAEVRHPLHPAQVMYAGLDAWSQQEDEILRALALRVAGAETLAQNSAPVLDWIAEQRLEYLAVHLDVDAMDPNRFRPVLFNKPDAQSDFLECVPRGQLDPETVVRLLQDVAEKCDIVGLAVTEYISWDAWQTKRLLGRLPLVAG